MADRFKLIPAVHLFLIKEDRILLLRRCKTGYEDGNYSVPAGHLDGDETATNAMVREAMEEAAVTINPKDLKLIHVMHRCVTSDTGKHAERVDFFFVTDTWKGKPTIAEPEKCDELAWYDLAKLPKNIVPYVKHALTIYRSGEFYSEFGW